LGISGQAGVNTCYVGAASSERRLRIYRKDLQDESYKAAYGPCMRVEVVLKGDYARAAWKSAQAASQGYEQRLAQAASAHISDMTSGALTMLQDAELPPTMAPATSSPAESIAAMVRQYWSWLGVCESLGVDLAELVEQQRQAVGRETAWRHKQRLAQAREQGSESLSAEVCTILQR
jgi:hypothetical protein